MGLPPQIESLNVLEVVCLACCDFLSSDSIRKRVADFSTARQVVYAFALAFFRHGSLRSALKEAGVSIWDLVF
jgi:hypothetical protein